jgi:hypothetical protein
MRILGAAIVVVLVFGTAAPASALGYVNVDPRYSNMYVAGCPTADTTRCIQTNGPLRAASFWCRQRGMSHATSYKTDALRGRNGAIHIETNTACQHPNCIILTEITCAGQASRPAPPATPPAPAYAPVRINTPSVNGFVVDWCLYWGRNCGAQTAYYVCQRLGYRGALNFATYRPGRTLVMGTNQLCQGANCVGFSYVTCAR